MTENQQYEIIAPELLTEKVQAAYAEGRRLVQVSATRLAETVELTYSFDLLNRLTNLRLELPAASARLQSISTIYGGAFIYENEIHDLFNVEFEGMTVDFKGNFYKTTVKHAFATPPAAIAKPAPKTAAKPAAAAGATVSSSAPAPAANPPSTAS